MLWYGKWRTTPSGQTTSHPQQGEALGFTMLEAEHKKKLRLLMAVRIHGGAPA
jgi:hypothetical protein